CRTHYLHILDEAVERTPTSGAKRRWILINFEAVDRKDLKTLIWYAHPLFYVDEAVYKARTEGIPAKLPDSRKQRQQQSEGTRVSYAGKEIYVDWSEALVCKIEDNEAPGDNANKKEVTIDESIEKNFVIAFASWLALALMNENSSVFLFEAFIGMATGQPL